MGKGQREKLGRELRRYGLVETLVWNRRTGNLVGGHQRLREIDRNQGWKGADSPDYSLDLAVIDVTEREEKAINVALNNPGAQGEYDPDLLGSILREIQTDLADVGIDRMDVEIMLGPDVAGSLFSADAEPEEIKAAADELERMAGLKERKKKHRAAALERDDTEFYTVVVFQSREQREAFMTHLGLGPEERYTDGRAVADLLGLELPPDPPAPARRPKREAAAEAAPDA